MPCEQVRNYIAGRWIAAQGSESAEVQNPATGERLAVVGLGGMAEVGQAVEAASVAFPAWRRVPANDRIQPLFQLKTLLEEHFEELARTITGECGKTIAESRGELRRAVENVETACGIPILMQGYNSEDIASGMDEIMIRQPLGVVAVIAPFNFPAMIPFWFFPYAIACGNTVVIKPSERVPLTMQRVMELVDATGLPKGVLNLVNGGARAVDAMIEHPAVRAVSFVGSTPVARRVYARAAAAGKRAQCQGGAKNAVVVLPDCDLETSTRIIADSAFGCAGQRCLAASIAITVGEAAPAFSETIREAALGRVTGNGMDEQVQMGPVISRQSQARIEDWIGRGAAEGASLLVDGRNPSIAGGERGYFVRPTVLAGVNPAGEVARSEIFGPVLSLMRVATLDSAIEWINSGRYGNMACLFTSSGASAREFRSRAEAGNIGINTGVAAPMASFPFSGWKESFFGDLHGQGRDAVEFFTEQKVVVERWPSAWSRRF